MYLRGKSTLAITNALCCKPPNILLLHNQYSPATKYKAKATDLRYPKAQTKANNALL